MKRQSCDVEPVLKEKTQQQPPPHTPATCPQRQAATAAATQLGEISSFTAKRAAIYTKTYHLRTNFSQATLGISQCGTKALASKVTAAGGSCINF